MMGHRSGSSLKLYSRDVMTAWFHSSAAISTGTVSATLQRWSVMLCKYGEKPLDLQIGEEVSWFLGNECDCAQAELVWRAEADVGWQLRLKQAVGGICCCIRTQLQFAVELWSGYWLNCGKGVCQEPLLPCIHCIFLLKSKSTKQKPGSTRCCLWSISTEGFNLREQECGPTALGV